MFCVFITNILIDAIHVKWCLQLRHTTFAIPQLHNHTFLDTLHKCIIEHPFSWWHFLIPAGFECNIYTVLGNSNFFHNNTTTELYMSLWNSVCWVLNTLHKFDMIIFMSRMKLIVHLIHSSVYASGELNS
jgi:hypothetical protein